MAKTVKQLEGELKVEQDKNKALDEQVVELKKENQAYKASNENLMLEGEKLSEENAILTKENGQLKEDIETEQLKSDRLSEENVILNDILDADAKKEIATEKKELASFDVGKAVADYFTANPNETHCYSTKTRLFGASNKALAIAGAGGEEGVKTHSNPNK